MDSASASGSTTLTLILLDTLLPHTTMHYHQCSATVPAVPRLLTTQYMHACILKNVYDVDVEIELEITCVFVVSWTTAFLKFSFESELPISNVEC